MVAERGPGQRGVQEPGAVARLDRNLGDQVLGQDIVEVGDVHQRAP